MATATTGTDRSMRSRLNMPHWRWSGPRSVATLDSLVTEREEARVQLRDAMREHETQVAAQLASEARLNAEVARISATLRAANQHIRAIEDSRIWRWTEPLRRFGPPRPPRTSASDE